MELFPSVRSSYDNSNASVSEYRDAAMMKNNSRRSSVPVTYTAEKVIGNGSFGVVYQAVSLDTNETVAIKKVFQDRRYKNRELQIMKELGNHQNIVTLRHAFYTNGDKPEELFLNVVMDYVSDTVYKVLKNYGKSKQQIPLILAKCYSYQIARGLAYMHSCGICHRDIKPQNLLICPTTHVLKLCDFGSAKKLAHNEPNVSYICSRYYRAPELIFGAVNYTFVVDNWSLGCVLGELIQGTPIFPGENGVDQLVQIIKVLGTPKTDDLVAMNPNYTEFKFPLIKPNSWDKVIPRLVVVDSVVRDDACGGGHMDGVEKINGGMNLLAGILQYDPKKRWSSWDILSSEFFDELRDVGACKLPPNNIGLPGNFFEFKDIEIDYLKKLSLIDRPLSVLSTAVSSPSVAE